MACKNLGNALRRRAQAAIVIVVNLLYILELVG